MALHLCKTHRMHPLFECSVCAAAAKATRLSAREATPVAHGYWRCDCPPFGGGARRPASQLSCAGCCTVRPNVRVFVGDDGMTWNRES